MIVLYTALFGGSDRLKPAPAGMVDRCVCFTDDMTLPRDIGWDVVPMVAGPDPRRSAWALRCNSHTLFQDAEIAIWLDASMLIVDLPGLINGAMPFEVAGLAHPERTSPYDEAAELIAIGQGDKESLTAQVAAYRADGFPGTALTTSGILVRRNTPAVATMNAIWHEEFLKYPGDNTQVSLDYAAWKAGLSIAHLTGTYIDTPYVTYDHEEHHRRRRPYR